MPLKRNKAVDKCTINDCDKEHTRDVSIFLNFGDAGDEENGNKIEEVVLRTCEHHAQKFYNSSLQHYSMVNGRL